MRLAVSKTVYGLGCFLSAEIGVHFVPIGNPETVGLGVIVDMSGKLRQEFCSLTTTFNTPTFRRGVSV